MYDPGGIYGIYVDSHCRCTPFSHPSAAPGCVLGAPEVMEAAIYETTALIILHKKTKKPENGVAWSVKTNR